MDYEKAVAWSLGQDCNEFYISDPLKIDITAYYSIPKSTSKKKYLLMVTNQVRPTKKPDIDNILKIICDALNGIAYKDDKQIVEATIRKRYDPVPRVVVTIEQDTV